MEEYSYTNAAFVAVYRIATNRVMRTKTDRCMMRLVMSKLPAKVCSDRYAKNTLVNNEVMRQLVEKPERTRSSHPSARFWKT